MRGFFVTMVAVATLTLGCNSLGTQPDPTVNVAAWQAQIAPAMGIAMLAAGSVSPDTPVNKLKRSECTHCSGTGRIRTGDGISWTECDYCVPDGQASPFTPEEVEQLKGSLKKLAALEAYQDKMQDWVENDMERYVLASVAKRKTTPVQTAPKPTVIGMPPPDIQPQTTTTIVTEQPTQTYVRRGVWRRRGGYRSYSAPAGAIRRGSCTSGACAI